MLIFCDGFDHYTASINSNTAAAMPKWGNYVAGGASTSVFTVGAGNGRSSTSDSLTGGLSAVPGWAAGGSPCGGLIQRALGTNAATLYTGFAVKVGPGLGHGPEDTIIAQWNDTGSVQIDLRWSAASGVLYYTRNGTSLTGASSGGTVLSTNIWSYIETKIVFSSSAGIIQMKINGATVCNVTGLNTQATGNAYANQLRIGAYGTGGSQGAPFNFDDLYICDGTGTVNNNFLGEIRIRLGLPSGNGTPSLFTNTFAAWVASTAMNLGVQILDTNGKVQQVTANTGDFKTGATAPTWATTTGATTTDNHVTWTNRGAAANWIAVSDTPNPDDDSSYVSDNTLGDKSYFTYPAISGASCNAVVVWLYAAKGDAGTRMIRAMAKSGAAEADNGVDMALSTLYSYAMCLFETDPNTSAQWTIAGVNAAQFGVKISV